MATHPTCACGQPTYIRISQSEKNPERPFYTCSTGTCNFFQWVDGKKSNYNRPKTTTTTTTKTNSISIGEQLKNIGNELRLIRELLSKHLSTENIE